MTLAQGDFCKDKELDAQDPPCARLILSGKTTKVAKGTKEADFARESLFTRHPNMADYPNGDSKMIYFKCFLQELYFSDHQFYFAKLEIERITLLAYYGGAKHVSLEDYFNADLNDIENGEHVLEEEEQVVLEFM